MSDVLKIAAIQSRLEWENQQMNLRNFDALLKRIPQDTDLVVLPEMFTTGFTMNPSKVFETMNGDSISWMKKVARDRDLGILGSLVIQENDSFVNRCVFAHPNGRIDCYDKRHCFTLAGEDQVYKAGKKKLIVHFRGWKVCPMICYDLRFPVWIRNTEDYDLLIFMANWPTPRIEAWDVLLKARAIENMSYTVGVNRIGTDENNYEYSGHSAIIDPLGKSLYSLPDQEEGILLASLKKSEQIAIRKKLNFLNDKDIFTIED